MILMLCVILFVVALIIGYLMDLDYYRARKLENEGKYKEAVYEYATATITSCISKNDCSKRIRNLWNKKGPFDYSDFLTKFIENKDEDSLIHHDAILEIIQKSI